MFNLSNDKTLTLDKDFSYFKIKKRLSLPVLNRWGGKGEKTMFSTLMLPTLVTIDEEMVASTTAYIGDLFTDVKLLVVLIIGLPLAFWVIRRIIGLVRAR